MHNPIRPLLCAAILTFSLGPAFAGPDTEISKVKYYHLEKDPPSVGGVRIADPMISFERMHHLYGAVSRKEQIARTGHYYAVKWKAGESARAQGVTLRFEYRQLKTGDAVKTKDIEVSNIKRKNVTKFSVIGNEYRDDGRVTAWRASLVQEGNVVASTQSFLWD